MVVKPKVELIDDYFSADIVITEASAAKDSNKRELIVTLLREGPGNKFHNNYYTKSALTSAAREVQSRPKQYYNHAKDVDNPDRDLRDWASSIMEAWVDTSEPRHKLKAKVKVFDNWLWERAKVAPDELAVSIEGKGVGRDETIEGKEFNAIHEIQRINGVNWVDYPGNAGMGVEVLEKDKLTKESDKEDKTMLSQVLEGLKSLSTEELKEVAKTRPELKEFFLFPQDNSETDKKINELTEQVKSIKADSDANTKGLNEKITEMGKTNGELSNKVEAHEIKDKSVEKEKLVDKMLSESKLKDDHKTDTFKKTLLAQEKEEDMKSLIEDREKICISETAETGQPGAGAGAAVITDKEKATGFISNIFGEKIEEKDLLAGVNGQLE